VDEECDGEITVDCESIGFKYGVPSCLPDCTLDYSTCVNSPPGCTYDPGGYGEIEVLDKWGKVTPIDDGGYKMWILEWGWKLKHTGEHYTTQGITLNYEILRGPGPLAPEASWGRTNDEGHLEESLQVYEPGTYTFRLIDFDTFGSYCGDGHEITLTAE